MTEVILMENLGWKIKAEEFLKSHLNDNNSDEVEAAIYFLSRGEKSDLVERAIEGAIKRWKEEENLWGHWTLAGYGFPAQVLRLIKWAEIGSLKEDWNRIYDELTLPANRDYLRDLHSNNSIIYAQTLPLFRSDLAIQNMRPKLLSLIFQWQDCLESFFYKKWMWKHRMEEDSSFEQSHAMLVTTFIFGVNRLQVNDINKKVLSKSIQYLIDNQSDSGSWGHNESISRTKNVMLAAMGIHALYPTRGTGSKRCIDKTVKYLLKHQQPNGGWHPHGRETSPDDVYATVFVLDAIELAGGGNKITFSVPTRSTEDDLSQGKLPDDIEQGKITIKTNGPLYFQQPGDSDEYIQLDGISADDIKKSIKLAENELIKDKINKAIFMEFQKYEMKRQSNPQAKPPTLRWLAKKIYTDGVGKTQRTPEAIRKRVKKLINAGLVTDYHANRRRELRESSLEQSHPDNNVEVE